jgi:large subunit ribosomal protein L13
MQKTYTQKPADVTREWFVIDANDQILGQVATDIAQKLIGKHKPTFTPHVDGGDYVVVINAAQVAVTRSKESSKLYYSHSHQPGGLKTKTLGELRTEQPEEIIRRAVYNMLPKNKLRSLRMNRLKIYASSEHKHAAQIAAKAN